MSRGRHRSRNDGTTLTATLTTIGIAVGCRMNDLDPATFKRIAAARQPYAFAKYAAMPRGNLDLAAGSVTLSMRSTKSSTRFAACVGKARCTMRCLSSSAAAVAPVNATQPRYTCCSSNLNPPSDNAIMPLPPCHPFGGGGGGGGGVPTSRSTTVSVTSFSHWGVAALMGIEGVVGNLLIGG